MLILTGCSPTKYLVYKPVIEKSPQEHLLKSLSIAVDIEDSRADNDEIGRRISSTYPDSILTTNESSSDWVNSALMQELSNVGYNVSSKEDSAPLFSVQGEILRLEAVHDPLNFSKSGKIGIQIKVLKNDKLFFKKRYNARVSKGTSPFSLSKSAVPPVLESLLQQVSKEFIEDFNAKTNEFYAFETDTN